MPERPRPDMDHTREALRRHDERPDEPPADDAPEEAAARDQGDEDEGEGEGPDQP